MKSLLWRLKFTASVIWIFREHKGNPVRLDWNTSGKTKYRHLSAWNAALTEIEDWYSL